MGKEMGFSAQCLLVWRGCMGIQVGQREANRGEQSVASKEVRGFREGSRVRARHHISKPRELAETRER